MAVIVDVTLRGPDAFALARHAMDEMERRQIWPTPLNYEIWLHVVGEPDGALAEMVRKLLESGQPFTDAVSEELATQFLPRLRLNDEIRDAGDQLSKQLESVAMAMAAAHRTNAAYGRTLAGAAQELAGDAEAEALRTLVESLALATTKVQKENGKLERRLNDSTNEIMRLREHLEQVRRDAMTDALTSLANRKAFDEALAKACADAAKYGKPLSVALLDIDHFKRFNDTWGHQTGDQVIRYVATIIGRLAAHPRLAARYGGEEFALLFPGEDSRQVASLMNQTLQEIACRALKRRSTNEDLGTVTVSAGVAQYIAGETGSAVMERADTALYRSKRSGRNRSTTATATDAAA